MPTADPLAGPASATADQRGGGGHDRETASRRLGNRAHTRKTDRAAHRERRTLLLDVVVDDPVIPTIDDAVVVEVAVEVGEGVRHLHEVIDDAVVAAVDDAIEIRIAGVAVLQDDRGGIDGVAIPQRCLA